MHRYLLLDNKKSYDQKAKAYRIVSAENQYLAEKELQEGKGTLRADYQNFQKARILLATTYYDSMEYAMMDYKEYVKMCREGEMAPRPEGSRAYYEHIDHLTALELDDFKSNLQHSQYNRPCLLTGSLGLWWNRHLELCAVKYDTLLDGVIDVMRRADCTDWEIKLSEGSLQLLGKHHDGTNTYTLSLLSAKGLRETERPMYAWEGNEYKPKPDWFRKIYGWLY